MTPQRVSMITLGTSDMARARQFYEALGWAAHPGSPEGLLLFQLDHQVLGIFDLTSLAEDQGRPGGATLGTGAMALAQNHATEAAVDAAFAPAIAAGATALKTPEKAFWGGNSGYWSDPDGHVWEVAMNPFWPLDARGGLSLPNGPA